MGQTEKFAALNSGKSYDFSWQEKPKCPHCGTDFSIRENDAWRLYDENDTHEVECPSCDLTFRVNSYADWRFSTDEQGE